MQVSAVCWRLSQLAVRFVRIVRSWTRNTFRETNVEYIL